MEVIYGLFSAGCEVLMIVDLDVPDAKALHDEECESREPGHYCMAVGPEGSDTMLHGDDIRTLLEAAYEKLVPLLNDNLFDVRF
jgi:hypothetical protein